ncbi:MAG: hypothetical protein P1V81_05370 [Planctomycetota bacterium]|nr:hypothetical protein [Planctomycetota bacterium]
MKNPAATPYPGSAMKHHVTLSVLALALLLSSCGEPINKKPPTIQATVKAAPEEVLEEDLTPEQRAAAEAAAQAAEEERLAAVAKAEAEAAAEVARRVARKAEADRRRKERAAEIFGEVMEPLTEASEAYDRHESLDESSWFGTDQEDNMELINEILDQAMGVLGVGEIAETRQRLRTLEEEIIELEADLLDLREQRVSAPLAEKLSKLEKTYKTSREEIDIAIGKAEVGVVEREAEIRDLEITFVEHMQDIGVELDLESARSLLSTVTGDDFVEMCVVFDNVRGVTLQLQELTEESGESLDAAKRYYGSYVVLIRLMDRIQKDFVQRTREEMVPRLAELSKEAEALIKDANRNMKKGGDKTIGEQNIRSNQLTIDATGYYVEYLKAQADEIEALNAELAVDLRDAINTYQTVSLSSEVASLMRESSRNFAALTRLQLPDLRGFDNAELRAEFERLTKRVGTPE